MPIGQADDNTSSNGAALNLKEPEDRVSQVNRWWTIARDAQSEWERQAREDLDFYLGRQWDAADLDMLKKEKRPALTFNYLLAIVNLASGIQRQNRQDLKAYPLKGGTREVAEILTAIFKHVSQVSMGDWHEAMVFVLGIITGKAFLQARVDYDDDPATGDLVTEYVSPFRIKHDPYHERYDLSDGDFIIKDAWLPKERIERMFPDKKDELSSLSIADDDLLRVGTETRSYKESANMTSFSRQDIQLHRYRVKQSWFKTYESQRFLINTESGQVTPMQLGVERLKALIAGRPNLQLLSRTRPVLHVNTSVGNVELAYQRDPLKGMTRFPIVPFFAYWLEGECFGIITNAKDPQREANKRSSQALHHLNQSANSGWIMDEGAVEDEDALENFGGKPGVVIKKRKGAFLQKITPTPISEGHLGLAEQSYNMMKRVTGVNADLLGQTPERQESGVAMLRRQQQGSTALESIYDNFRFTRLAYGKVLIDMVQRSGVYSHDEVLTLVVDGEPQQVAVNQPQRSGASGAVGQVLNDLSVGKYGVTVDMQTQTPTTRWAHFLQLIEAVKSGLPIPARAVLEASDIPNKDQIIAEMQAASAQGPPAGGPGGALPTPGINQLTPEAAVAGAGA